MLVVGVALPLRVCVVCVCMGKGEGGREGGREGALYGTNMQNASACTRTMPHPHLP